MNNKIQHPLVIVSLIVGMLGTTGAGVGAYTTIKEDVRALNQGLKDAQNQNKERYESLREDTRDIKALLNGLLLRQQIATKP